MLIRTWSTYSRYKLRLKSCKFSKYSTRKFGRKKNIVFLRIQLTQKAKKRENGIRYSQQWK